MTAREPTRLGEVLRAAREARFIDLARVERDTKIRARYLDALERGDYRELPGSVYIRGFLRNYGIYLGLDPEYLIDLYRLEEGGRPERRSAPAPLRPVSERGGRPLVVSSSAVAAVILSLMVILFVVYLAGEFITFARTPDLRITDPAGDLPAFAGTEYTIRGLTEPNSVITVDGLPENPTATADGEGAFSITVGLVPGANVMMLVARDPVTGRDSAAVRRTIQVVSAAPSASPAGAVTIQAPEGGATIAPGEVVVAGRAPPGSLVRVSAALAAPVPATFTITALGGSAVPLPGEPPSAPLPVQVTVAADGSFDAALALPAGTWDLRAALLEDLTESATRRVTVTALSGLAGVLTVSGSRSYLEIDEDGVPKADISGREAQPGTSVEISAAATLRIRVGNAGAIALVVNGVALPAMGADGAVVEWLLTRLP